MNQGNSEALIVSFYLSKYDKVAYKNLNYGNAKNTHEEIGKVLSVKSNTIKNMRDEFDPLHDNQRVGWYQRPLAKSRRNVYDTFSNLPESALREIVFDILNKCSDEPIKLVLESISKTNESNENTTQVISFTSRGITGEKAEEYFKKNWKKYYPKFEDIENRTKDGCGYDFTLVSSSSKRYIEVKGLKDLKGGVLLTSKEWDVASNEESLYDLFIVCNLDIDPKVKIISNPASKLKPSKNIQTVIQVNWSLSSKQIEEA